MPYINVGQENSSDIELYYEDHGQGDPILLIHGYPFSGLAWEKQTAFFLNEGYRVITYDRRGFGLSAKPSVGYDYDTFAKDLDIIINELKLQNLTLVGHSMGTGEVVRYLSKYGSKRVKRGVLVAPLAPFLLKTDDNETGVDEKVFDGFKEAIQKDRYAFITEFLKNFYNLSMANKDVSAEKLSADFNLAAISSPTAFLKCVDAWITDFREDLPELDVPILVIHGNKDNILPFDSTAKLLPDLIKKCELKIIKNGSHGIPWTHGDEISKLIFDFIPKSPLKTTGKTDEDSRQLH